MSSPEPGKWVLCRLYRRLHLPHRTADEAIFWCGRPIEDDWQQYDQLPRSKQCTACKGKDEAELDARRELLKMQRLGRRSAW